MEKYSYKIIKKIRVKIPDIPGALGKIAQECGNYGVVLGDITKVHLTTHFIIRDIIAYFNSDKHFQETINALRKLKSYTILSTEDEVLHLHKGGKIAVQPTVRMETLNDLRMLYTPGVAQVCNYIAKNPKAARKYTSIGKTVCIATNGSAVLGLGNIGVLASMPVMEGKSLILHKMAGVSCVPILLESNNAETITNSLASISKTFAAIMIEDIQAPLCFEVETALQKRVSIPVFHDDQHGTATVILAALIKALKLQKLSKKKVTIVINGAGAAGIATGKMLLQYGFKNIIVCDRKGAIYKGRRENMNCYKEDIARSTNKKLEKGTLAEVIRKKDIFIGVSSPRLVTQDMVKSMKKNSIVFALANPIPEIKPKDAKEAGAAIALDGRTINNCLVFPGLMLGTLRACASQITYSMKFKAAETIAELSGKREIVPNFMNFSVHQKVAKAVEQAALGNKSKKVTRTPKT